MREWVRWRIHYFNKKRAGQALLELAIFGSLLVMLLGVLVNYGLRYYQQQVVMQEAFRKAEASAAGAHLAMTELPGGIGKVLKVFNYLTPISSTHIVIKDVHIPDPQNPWAVGQVSPVQSGASVTRNYQLHESADLFTELPQTILHINQDTPRRYTTAGFRLGIGLKAVAEAVYGGNNVWKIFPKKDILPFIDYGIYVIQDPVAGEVFDYDTAARQCQLLKNAEVAIDECLGSISPIGALETAMQDWFNGGGGDLGTILRPFLNQFSCLASGLGEKGMIILPPPAYCDEKDSQGRYVKLEEAFKTVPYQASGNKALGLQNDVSTLRTANNVLHKQENYAGITVNDTIDWKETITRNNIIKEGSFLGVPLADLLTRAGRMPKVYQGISLPGEAGGLRTLPEGYPIVKKEIKSEVLQNKTYERKKDW